MNISSLPALRSLGCVVWIAATGAVAPDTFAGEHRVSSAADIVRVTNALKPGDALVMADGIWKDQAIVFNGTAEPLF